MHNVKLLILDDNCIVRRTISFLAVELGYSVLEAATVDEARASLAENDCDILLCDDDLGTIESGMDLINGQIEPRPATIILMSGNPIPDKLPDNVIFLSKPFTITQLEFALKR